MDCKYINQNNIHERYLLDRLKESEKSEYLSHLKSCENCKNALESEKDMISSIRYFGKSEMKSEIVKQVAEIKSRKTNVSWDMILKVAAIFFFLVITPGLVYYYQTIEPPKISEFYNFDGSMNQKEEEIEEAEEIETDGDLGTVLVKEREKLDDENVSDIIKSADGAGKVSSLQSVGIAKPAKKFAPRVETPAELVAKDDIDYESEQPSSPAPKSTFPELDKFKKPEHESILGQEVNNAKVLGRNRISTASRSIFNETKSGKMSVIREEAIDEPKYGRISSDKLSDYNIIKLDYKIDNQSIIVNLVPLSENSDFYLQNTLPDSFPVLKKKNSKANLEMDWFVNSALLKINSDKVLLNIEKGNTIFVNIKNSKTYQIDLKSDTTKAVIVH